MLPRVAPTGPGGHPGSGFVAERAPILGSTASRVGPTIISKPVRPDNARQTIIQASSPPDLRISTELKLPNVLVGNESAPKAPLTFIPTPKPNQMNRHIADERAPAVEDPTSQTPMATFLEPTDSQSRLAIPVGVIGLPRRLGSGSAAASDVTNGGTTGEAALLSIGVDPAATMSQLSLPPGNRLGEFSISEGGAGPGSPGGTPTASLGAGTGGGAGGAGDPSIGLGAGAIGGGGGEAALPGNVSINGSKSVDGNIGRLDPAFVPDMVYPVLSALKVRKNPLVISVGARGGGGLDTYGALKCGKIYTIFLPMPRANWTMLFCHESGSGANTVSSSPSPIIQLESGIVPPDPDLDSRFDFKRLPVSADKKSKMIVLKGTLQEDGSVADLKIYQSILPAMDDAARDAFSRWKFKPAMREGKPLAVQILVGIPAEPLSP
jgi:TonB family protein